MRKLDPNRPIDHCELFTFRVAKPFAKIVDRKQSLVVLWEKISERVIVDSHFFN